MLRMRTGWLAWLLLLGSMAGRATVTTPGSKGYLHGHCALVQLLHAGRVCEHFTLRALQRRQPPRLLLWVRSLRGLEAARD